MFMTFFRPKRMRQLVLLFSVSKNTTVLDVGGFYKNWSYLEDTPQLTLINLGPRPELLPVEVKYVRGDARKLPFADKSFDVVYSNSVIEHVGGSPIRGNGKRNDSGRKRLLLSDSKLLVFCRASFSCANYSLASSQN